MSNVDIERINAIMSNPIAKILTQRDELFLDEIREDVETAKDMLNEFYDPQTILEELWGLEPDYVYDLFDLLRLFPET